MEPLKTVGEEVKSNLQLLLTLILSPLAVQYLLWEFLLEVRGVSTSGEVTSALRETPSGYLANATSSPEFFTDVVSSQTSSLFTAVSKTHIMLFLVGGLMAAFLMAEPIYRGTILNDIALMGKKKTLAGRLLFMVVYAVFLAAYTGVVFWGISDTAGISPGQRFFISLAVAAFLSVTAGAFLVVSLSAVSNEPVLPLAVLFAAGIMSTATARLNDLLMPFVKFTYFLWKPDTAALRGYVCMGMALYTVLALASVRLFEGGDLY